MVQQGKLFCFIGILMALIQGGFTRRVRAGSEGVTCVIALILCVVAFVVVGVASTVPATYGGLAIYAFPSAVVVPCLTAMASRIGDATAGHQGTLLGVLRSLGSLARAFGPFVFAAAYWLLGAELSFVLGGVAFLAPAAILWPIRGGGGVGRPSTGEKEKKDQ